MRGCRIIVGFRLPVRASVEELRDAAIPTRRHRFAEVGQLEDDCQLSVRGRGVLRVVRQGTEAASAAVQVSGA